MLQYNNPQLQFEPASGNLPTFDKLSNLDLTYPGNLLSNLDKVHQSGCC